MTEAKFNNAYELASSIGTLRSSIHEVNNLKRVIKEHIPKDKIGGVTFIIDSHYAEVKMTLSVLVDIINFAHGYLEKDLEIKQKEFDEL